MMSSLITTSNVEPQRQDAIVTTRVVRLSLASACLGWMFDAFDVQLFTVILFPCVKPTNFHRTVPTPPQGNGNCAWVLARQQCSNDSKQPPALAAVRRTASRLILLASACPWCCAADCRAA
jgi:hypothetical protein